MSADGRAEVRRQEVCAVDVKNRPGSDSFRDAIAGQSFDPTLVAKPDKRSCSTSSPKGCGTKDNVSKGDDEFPNYRSRLVAREI